MKHYAVTILVLLVVASAHLSFVQVQSAAAQRHPELSDVLDIPLEIGEYRRWGEDYKVEESIKEQLQTSLILIRNYRSPEGWPVQLTIVYAGVTRRSLHFPEVCLVGQGWEIRDKGSEMVGFSFNAKRLFLVKNREEQVVLYWFKTGEELTGNFYLNSWFWAKNQVMLGSPTSAMIKLSAPMAGRDEEDVVRSLEDFAMKLTPILMDRVR